MYSIIYSVTAENDIRAVFDYIAADSRETAVSFMAKMEQSILTLREFPEIGHTAKYPELKMLGIRILPFEKYLIFYKVDKTLENVNIVRVLHGSRNYRNLF